MAAMTKLSVNLNKVALLRNQRDYGIPSVVAAARVCIEAGAYGITVHPRPDQRHITPRDVDDLVKLLTEHPGVEFNIEGNPFEGKWLAIVERVRPAQATLVPDSPDQRTSDHGWDMAADARRLAPIIKRLRGAGIRVSVFMDPDVEQIARVPAVGADRIELYTESYATAFRQGDYAATLDRYVRAAVKADELGLGINAGHDLNLKNLGPFCKAIAAALPAGRGVLEVSIGHEITGDALFMGLANAVKAYLRVLSQD